MSWDADNEKELARVTAVINEKFPTVRELLRTDVDREILRCGFRCPLCRRLLETVVLDEDANGYLMLRSLKEWEEGDFATETARAAMPSFGRPEAKMSPDSMTLPRLTLPCPRKKCTYDGTRLQSGLLELFVAARFVLDTPSIPLPS